MRTSTVICIATVLFLSAAPAMAALYTVDIGTPTSEAGYNLQGWGPVEPTTHGGNYGGIATDPLSWDGLCRVIWDSSDDDPSASLTFSTPVNSVTIRHLTGLADDSFNVNVYGGSVLWGSIDDTTSSTEVWTTSTLDGAASKTITLTATGAKWSGFDTYGQVAIDRIEAVPVPAAVLLGMLGLGAAGVKLRRFV